MIMNMMNPLFVIPSIASTTCRSMRLIVGCWLLLSMVQVPSLFISDVNAMSIKNVPHNHNKDTASSTTSSTTSSIALPSSTTMISTRRNAWSTMTAATVGFAGIATTTMIMNPTQPASAARLEPVNNPQLLPSTPGLNVIQIEKFLTTGQAKRMDQLLAALERDTGYRVRVLCQSYPNTPGLAIRDYWNVGKPETQKDDKYIILVVDQFGGRGNVLNFNVGEGMKLVLPNIFWTRLQGTYGTTFYVRDNGIDLAITNAVEAIVTCLRSENQYCVQIPDAAPSLKSLGMV